MTTLSSHSYGASHIRLLRITRRGDRHDLRDLVISVNVEGEVADAFTKGDNELLLPADTLRNTVHAIARDVKLAEIEHIGLALAQHFMEHQPQFTRVRVELSEQPWARLPVGGRAQGQAFTTMSGERRTAAVTSNGSRVSVVAGIEDFTIMKTSGAAFEGYLSDQFTTIEAVPDRVLSVTADAHWTYLHEEIAFGPTWQGVRQLLIEAFVEELSRSVEHSAHAMAEIALSSYVDLGDVTVRLRQRSLPLVELAQFGLDNPHVLFRPEEAPELTAEVTRTREVSR
jgi:urate oxidase